MKTIAQFVTDGINTPGELEAALQTAMQLEFATIPPYLCAQWSINTDNNGDPSDVSDMIGNIVVQEMFHFALAGNILSAIGGVPNIANTGFVPTYPTNTLPGGIPQKLAVDLRPLSAAQLDVFMQIENPEFPPVALVAETPPPTIGAFYDTIAQSLESIKPTFNPAAHFVVSGEAVKIESIADAKAAIARIKAEGEGTPGSPDQPPADGTTLAHYYVFKEIKLGKTLTQINGVWEFGDPAIQMPGAIYDFPLKNHNPSQSAAFNRTLSALLTQLQTCWTTGAQPDVGAMFNLQSAGIALVKQGIRPEFAWAS